MLAISCKRGASSATQAQGLPLHAHLSPFTLFNEPELRTRMARRLTGMKELHTVWLLITEHVAHI